jgi:DNA segregation ATPase FtsK/SpoIIIE-like protein
MKGGENMDLLTGFGIGAVIWTVAQFLPARQSLIEQTWKNLGLVNKEGKAPIKVGNGYYLPAGLTPGDVQATLSALSYQLGATVDMEVKGKKVILHTGILPDCCSMGEFAPRTPLEIPIGYSLRGLVTCDMSSDSHTAFLIGGAPGYGKSSLMNLIIHSVSQNYTPEQVRLVLIDLKNGIEFGHWQNLPHVLRYTDQPDQVKQVLRIVKGEIARRMELFKTAGVKKLSDYNRKTSEKLPYILMLIDEYAELSLEDKQNQTIMKRLVQTGRAAGIRFIMALQRPTVSNIIGDIKGLINTRIAFKCSTEKESRIILDKKGAEELPDIQGRAIYLTGAKYTTLQVPLFEPSAEQAKIE